MALTEPNEIKTIAFPGISTGAYGFPMERAANIAVSEVRQFLENNTSLDRVILVAFGERAYNFYQQALL